jgi:hypothetical protein
MNRLVYITIAPCSSVKELAELHDAPKVVTSLLLLLLR